ncbi:hypothetical protein HDU86_006617 [Geranomyces michiganensis]|nr:hypothetical protein HDU86_006617 [Geranomyces michiganensis]
MESNVLDTEGTLVNVAGENLRTTLNDLRKRPAAGGAEDADLCKRVKGDASSPPPQSAATPVDDDIQTEAPLQSPSAIRDHNAAASPSIVDEVPAVPDTVPSVFGEAITAIKRARKDDDHLNPMYWAALDLRKENGSPGANAIRAKNLLPPQELCQIDKRFTTIMKQAAQDFSVEAGNLLEILEALSSSLDTPRELGREVQKYGSVRFFDDLKDRIRSKKQAIMTDLADAKTGTPDSDYDEQGASHLISRLSQLENKRLDPDDIATRWILRAMETCCEIENAPTNVTERTNDVYYLMRFAILPSVSLRYGDGASLADRDDKKRRLSNAGSGKKVDFNYFIGSRELGVGENAGDAPSVQKIDSDWISCVKTAISQARSIRREAFGDKNPADFSRNTVELASQVACPFFLVEGTRIRFFLLFVVGTEIYAFNEYGTMSDVSQMDSKLKVFTRIARFFLIFERIMLNTNAKVNLVLTRVQEELLQKAAAEDPWAGPGPLPPTPVSKSLRRSKQMREANAPVAGPTPTKMPKAIPRKATPRTAIPDLPEA